MSHSISRGLLLLPLLAALALAAPPQGDSSRIRSTTLANGVHVLLLGEPNPLQENVWGTLLVRAGAMYDPQGLDGLTELFCASLVEGGSVKTPGKDLLTWLDAHRASIAAASELEALRIDFSAPKAEARAILERVRDLVRAPALPEELVADRRTTLIEQTLESEEPAHVLERLALGTATRAGRKPTARTLWAVTRDDLLAFHKANIGAGRAWLGVCGGFEPAELEKTVAELFGELPKVEPAPPLETPSIRPCKTNSMYLLPGMLEEDALISLIGRGPARGDPDFPIVDTWSAAFDALPPDPARAAEAAAEGLQSGPLLWFEASPAGFGAFHAEALARVDAARLALTRCLAPITPEGLDAIPKDLPVASLRAALPRVGGSDRFLLEEALRRAFEGTSAPAAAAPTITVEQLVAAVKRWVNPSELWTLAVGPPEVLLAQFGETREVLILDPTHVVGSTYAGLVEAERMFEALGGREHWAALGSVATEGDVVVQEKDHIATKQWRDLVTLRLRQEQTRDGATEIVVVGLRGGWTQRGDQVTDMPAALQRRTLRRMEGHLFQVLHDLAIGSGIGARIAADGALELVTPDGLLCWIELAEDGKPAKLGWPPAGAADGALFRFEDWTTTEGYPWPRRVIQPEQNVVSTTTSLRVNAVLFAELFRRGGK